MKEVEWGGRSGEGGREGRREVGEAGREGRGRWVKQVERGGGGG